MSNEAENESAAQKRRRGRPSFEFVWPQAEFTAEQIFNSLENKLSRVSVHSKINKAVSRGELAKVGTIKPRTGRPKSVYKRVNAS